MTVRLTAALALLLAPSVLALDGQPGMHDPSSVVVDRGQFYVLGTGAGMLDWEE